MPRASILRVEGLAFGPHPRHRLDLYLPNDPVARQRLVAFFYGGGWAAGTRRTYRFIGHALAASGYAVAVPDYRLFPEARFPDFLEDCADAVAWLQANVGRYGVDGRRMALLGHSAGAYNAVMLALDPLYLARRGLAPGAIAGVAALAPPCAFHPVDYANVREVFLPCLAEPDAARCLTRVRPGAPPMLLAHGLVDHRVWPLNSELMAAALRAQGNDVELRLYRGHGHLGVLLALVRPFTLVSPVGRDVARFLRRTLHGGHASGADPAFGSRR